MFIESIHYYSSLYLSPLYPVPHLSPQIQLRGAVSAVPDPLGRHGPDSDLKPDDLSLISDKFACCVPPSGTYGGVSATSGDGAFETCWVNKTLTSVLLIVGVSHISMMVFGGWVVAGRNVGHQDRGGMPLIVWRGCRSQFVVNPVKRWKISVVKTAQRFRYPYGL